MRDYAFFFSYASADRIRTGREAESTDRKDLVRRFFDDLNRELIGLGYPDGGFFDKLRLEARWKNELFEGLASSRVLVPLYSPNYFLSRYCGKEWETFKVRFDENERGDFPDVSSKTVMRPVLWKAPVSLPAGVEEFQVDYEDSPPEYKKYGLEYIMTMSKFNGAYRKFVVDFAQKIVTLANEQGAPKVRQLEDYEDLNPTFPGINRPGLKVVRYVFVAGMKKDMQPHRKSIHAYPNYQDRSDWLPYVPPHTNRQVLSIATGPAKSDGRQCDVLVPGSPDIMERLRDARRLNNVIIVIVDPWSLRLNELRTFLTQFDQEDFPNSAVLINWNSDDEETAAKGEELKNTLQDYFQGRVGRKEFYKNPISSPEGMETAVREAFFAVQARLVEKESLSSAAKGNPVQAPTVRN
jgi:FxsC-like protein